MSRQEIIRYIVRKDEFDIAYYNLGIGAKEAYSYAVQNAARYHGEFYAQLSDGTYQLIKSYK
jgi:hypothetical protein